MASIALGVAGAVVGSFFGPIGVSVGWALGAGIGNFVGSRGSHTEGPKLSDLRLQNSAYGVAIPVGYGTKRVAGNLIDQTNLEPHEHTTSSGKGGGHSSTSTTTSYSASLLVQIAQCSYLDLNGALYNNPIKNILRIWAAGRLIYGPGSPGDAVPITVYYGTEDQEPDPTFEAIHGVGEQPAYLGKAYVVFTDWDMSQFGNTVPALEFEVQFSGNVLLDYYSLWPVDFDWIVDSTSYSYPYTFNGVDSSVAGQITQHRYRSGEDYFGGSSHDTELYYKRKTFDLQGNVLEDVPETMQTLGQSGYSHLDVFGSMNSGHAYAGWQEQVMTDSGLQVMDTFAWLKDGLVTYSPDESDNRGLNRGQGIYSLLYWNGNLYAVVESLSGNFVRRYPAPDGSCYTEDYDASFDLYDYTRVALGARGIDLILGSDGYLYCRVSGTSEPGVLGGAVFKLLKFDADLNLITAWYTPHALGSFNKFFGTPGYSSAAIWNGYYVTYVFGGVSLSGGVYCMHRMAAELSDWEFIDEIEADPIYNGDSPPTASPASPLVYLASSPGLAAFRGGILQLGNDYISLGAIVQDISRQVGYADNQMDVSQLTDQVRGYVIGERMSGRAAIDALRPVYQFGAVESNLAVKFRKWKGDIDVTIPDSDLGARPFGDDKVEPDEVTRALESDLPRSIDILFHNPDMDYQEGHQLRQREVTQSDLDVTVTAPVVLTPQEALRAADMLLFNAWVERDKFKTPLARKYSYLEPTDVVAIRGRARRLVNKEEQPYTHIIFDGVAAVTSVFVTAPTPSPPLGFVPPAPPAPNGTDTRLLDLPLIVDTDSAGYYAAMAGRQSGVWPSATLLKSVDGGVNYTTIIATSDPIGMGVTTTALGDWTDWETFDESNSVTVRMSPGSPELVSSNEVGVLNGANIAALGSAANGWEIIQYKTATLVGTRLYQLSGLLRGRRGSEQMIDTHVIGDLFTVLPALNIASPGAELGQERLFKGITAGRLLSSETAIAFTNNGTALKCYAPTNLGGGRDASGNLTLTWTRRTRIGGSWLDNVDVPLSEPFEAYDVIIYTDSTYATIKSENAAFATTSFVYTASLQTTEFGSPQAIIYWGVKQAGSNGNGYEARSSS